jgi:hypothetical protein
MMDEAALRHDIARANRARLILEDELVVEALGRMEARCHAAWAHSTSDQAAAREEAYRMLRAVKTFRAELEQVIRGGQLAKAEIEGNARKAEGRRQQGEG